jgi:hypothetical protein
LFADNGRDEGQMIEESSVTGNKPVDNLVQIVCSSIISKRV